jgi:hypothetical protein
MMLAVGMTIHISEKAGSKHGLASEEEERLLPDGAGEAFQGAAGDDGGN